MSSCQRRTLQQLIEERKAACPEETGKDLEFNAKAGYVEMKDGFFLPWKEYWAIKRDPDLCDCIDCLESGEPCGMDCDRDKECAGCREARLNEEDDRDSIDFATGRR